MLLIGTKNTATQAVPAGNPILIGDVYRKYCKKNNCGVRAFDTNANSINIQHSGIYKVHATITFTGDAAGDVTFQLTQGGIAIPGAITTETVTTATTEINTTSIDYFVLIDSVCVLGNPAIFNSNIGVTNTGTVDATVTNFVLNIDKVV